MTMETEKADFDEIINKFANGTKSAVLKLAFLCN